MTTLVLLRHGESIWNQENRFTGWTDVDLSKKGVAEAHHAGQLLKAAGFSPDRMFTSYLKRAINTAWIVLNELDMIWIPQEADWRLNERHYGALQGLNKADTIKQYGQKQVDLWRRSVDEMPPLLDPTDERYPGHENRYVVWGPHACPRAEDLQMTADRVIPYFNEQIVPCLNSREAVLIVAHGNSLRALVQVLDRLNPEQMMDLEIPTGVPLIYNWTQTGPVRKGYL
jgi:2,3-bisphosphoglycerate-dependent phosphoglycerate mutase